MSSTEVLRHGTRVRAAQARLAAAERINTDAEAAGVRIPVALHVIEDLRRQVELLEAEMAGERTSRP